MDTDDDLGYFVGSRITSIRVSEPIKTSECEECEDEECEIQFLIVSTSKGDFTISNYNENNGYYGGFSIITLVSIDGDSERLIIDEFEGN